MNHINVTHPVPTNALGYFAMHCRDNQPVDPEALFSIIDGPLKAMEPKLEAELSKPEPNEHRER